MRRVLVFITLFVIPLETAELRAEPIMPLAQVRPGMRGYGLTVFAGTAPERFDIEVIDVLHQFLPRQDLILVRMDHPLLERAGTVGGMSGSPIYVGDRLVGALAYGWLYSLDPIAGITPIETMLEELDRPLRGSPPLVGNTMPRVRPPSAAAAGRNASGRLSSIPLYWQQFVNSEGPVPAATPLLLGGFSARVRSLLGELLRDFSLIPIEAGGGGRRLERAGSRPFVPGGPIGVQLIRGDLSATGIGTVTSVRGSRVLAFGHPMFGYGQQHYPVSTARIITIISSRRRSFKLGEPVAEAGALIQDRQSCIIADTSGQGPMTQLELRVRDRSTGRRDQFDVEVVQERFLLPLLSMSAVAAALDRFSSDRTDLMVSMRGELHLARGRRLVLEDEAFTERGAADSRTLLGMRPLAALSEIVANPFEQAQLDRVVLDVSMDFQRDEAEIVGAYVTAEQLIPGATVPIHVILRPYGSPEELRVIPVELPLATAGQEIELHVDGGSSVSPPTPVPQSLDDLLDNIEHGAYPSTSIVVSLKRRAQGISLRGHIAQDLPPSAIDALRPLAVDAGEQPFATLAQVTAPTGLVISGQARLRLHVEDSARE